MELNRKKIIIAVFFGFILFLVVGYFLILSKQEQKETIETTQNLFPFGEITPGDTRPDGSSQGTVGDETSPGTQETGTIEPEPELPAGPRLRKISDFPTGGFTPIIRIEEKQVADIEIDNEGNTLQTTKTIEVKNQFVRYSAIKDATVYETKVTPEQLESDIVVDNFIPNAEYAYFNNNGNHILFQYWNKESRTPESYLASIKKIGFKVPECPIDFSPIKIGMDEARIIGIHQFLNKQPQTRIARTGANSPGNETSLVDEATITAIKNFQSLYQLDIDGELGPATRKKMLELCDQDMEQIARAEYDALERRYTISGFFLPQDIIGVSMSPDGEKVFYLQKDAAGIIGVVRNLLKETKETIFESPFTEWIPVWNNNESIELSTKPSHQVDGYSYQLNPSNKRYFKSLPERKGLTTLASPDNTKILTMEATNSSTRLSIHTRESNRTRPLSIQTMVEKCVWSPNNIYLYCAVPNAMAYGNEYPDVWYQGIETYTDSLWKINTKTFEEEVISDIVTEYGPEIDVESINVDPEEEYLYFIDKKTEELWSYRLD